MNVKTLLLAIVIASASTAFAQTELPVLNAGFEDDVLACTAPCFGAFAITGWVGPAVVQTVTANQYPNGIPGGKNVAAIGNGNQTGSLSQTTGGVVHANRTYTLRVSVGQRLDGPMTGYLVLLLAGNTVLASDSRLRPAPGTFLEDVIVYKSGSAPMQAGQNLQILLKSYGTGQVDMDNVSLTEE